MTGIALIMGGALLLGRVITRSATPTGIIVGAFLIVLGISVVALEPYIR